MDRRTLTTLMLVWRAFRQASEQARLHDALLRRVALEETGTAAQNGG